MKTDIEKSAEEKDLVNNWHGWLSARIPHLHKEAYNFWIKQALKSISEDAVEQYLGEHNQWISVKDRLPEFNEPVLVFCRIYGRYLATYKRIDEDYEWGEWRDFNNKVCLPPTHWMSLPNPPKV